jgi:hypothetical protein
MIDTLNMTHEPVEQLMAYLEEIGEDDAHTVVSDLLIERNALLAMLQIAEERIEINNYEGEEDEYLNLIRIVISHATGADNE